MRRELKSSFGSCSHCDEPFYTYFLNFVSEFLICGHQNINVHTQSRRLCSDYDEDCSDGLVCWNDIDGSGVVPGCSGSPMEGWEYCIDPNATASVEADSTAPSLTETDPLDRCVGDW